jgi:hypothetical protein
LPGRIKWVDVDPVAIPVGAQVIAAAQVIQEVLVIRVIAVMLAATMAVRPAQAGVAMLYLAQAAQGAV